MPPLPCKSEELDSAYPPVSQEAVSTVCNKPSRVYYQRVPDYGLCPILPKNSAPFAQIPQDGGLIKEWAKKAKPLVMSPER